MVLVKPLCTGIGVVGELCGGILRVKPRGRGPELSIGLTETGSRGRASSRSVEPGFGPSPGSGIRYTMVGFPGGIQAHRIKLLSICRVSFGWEWRMSLVPFPLEYALYRISVNHSRASRNPEL